MGVNPGLTLRGKKSLKVFENRVLRRIFEPKKDEVIGGWRKLHNYRSFITCTLRQVHLESGFCWGKLERPRRRWVDIKTDVTETGWGGMDWINVAQDRVQRRSLVNAVMNLPVP
jgi:hypothetical protein